MLLFVRAGDIWIAHGDGTGQRLLIKNGDVPCWSPDKKEFAFERASNIWVAHADGTHQKPLTKHWTPLKRVYVDIAGVENIGIAWDKGLAIFYSHGEAPANKSTTSAYPADCTDLFTIPLYSLPDTLALDPAGRVGGFGFSDLDYPAVSRDGSCCAFVCNGDIWIASRDQDRTGGVPGWSFARLKPVAIYDSGTNRSDAWVVAATHLSWSPDGRRLAYSLDRISGSGQYEMHLLDLKHNRLNQTTIVADRILNEDGTYPCFSPNGKWIAYWGPTPSQGATREASG